MTTLTERAAIANDPAFQLRVRQAVTGAAIAVAYEDPNDPDYPPVNDPVARRTLAARVLARPAQWATLFAVGVSTTPNVGLGVSDPSKDSPDGDNALVYVMGQLWNAYTEPAPADPLAARMTDEQIKAAEAARMEPTK